jgi:hypothetical protein
MYLGNGVTAPAVNHVIVGQVVAGASTITSTIAYALMGRYDSGYTNTFPSIGTVISKNHNIGVPPQTLGNLIIKCLTAEQGYSIGDVTQPYCVTTTSYTVPYVPTTTNLTIGFAAGTTITLDVIIKNTGGFIAATPANWAYKLTVSRGW